MDFKERMAKARASRGKGKVKLPSRKKAIRDFCIECFGGGRGGRTDNVVIYSEIRKCTDLGCPLYEVRPYKKQVKVE